MCIIETNLKMNLGEQKFRKLTICEPTNDLSGQLKWIPGNSITRLADGVVDELQVRVEQVASHVLEHAAQVADRDRLHGGEQEVEVAHRQFLESLRVA